MRIHQGFLANRTWPVVSVLLCLIAVTAFLFYAPEGRRDGSTVVGYTLGVVSALIVVWLAWLGVMKRRFASSAVRRRNKVSAHIWLGLSLLMLAGLHSGFQFDYSYHTLTYILLVIVVLSGVFGIYFYAKTPRRMNSNVSAAIVDKRHPDLSDTEQLEMDIADIDARIERALQYLPDAFRDPIRLSLERTRIGGGFFAIMSGSSRGCATARALRQVKALAAKLPEGDENAARVAELVADLTRKAEVASCLRRDIRYRALLTLWLWIHIPVTVALIVTLIGHIVLVFFYW
ncbi:hypothetical protein KHP62_10675 [Rhodobacteraceae bacterium NNCM2]|nr:hypothetical protein [Coraliihabitans acroporae]